MFLNQMIESAVQVACLKTNALRELEVGQRLVEIEDIVKLAKQDILEAIGMSNQVRAAHEVAQERSRLHDNGNGNTVATAAVRKTS